MLASILYWWRLVECSCVYRLSQRTHPGIAILFVLCPSNAADLIFRPSARRSLWKRRQCSAYIGIAQKDAATITGRVRRRAARACGRAVCRPPGTALGEGLPFPDIRGRVGKDQCDRLARLGRTRWQAPPRWGCAAGAIDDRRFGQREAGEHDNRERGNQCRCQARHHKLWFITPYPHGIINHDQCIGE
jgi:hypothetical protein